MKWFKSLTRELPFHTWENWQDTYFGGWYNLLGFGLKNVIYDSQRNIVAVYRVKDEWDEFLFNLKRTCLEKPDLIRKYFEELEKLDKKLVRFENKEIRTKEDLKKYINEIKIFIKYYSALYLIKLYSNMAMDEEVVEKQPELVKKARELAKKAEWFELSKAIIKNVSNILKLSENVAASINFDEILKYIDTEHIDYELAEKRYAKVVYVLNKNKYFFGKEANNYIKTLDVVDEEIEKSTILKGIVANKGLVKGEVVIVLGTKDFYKIKEGSIIVAHMTTPWYVPYLKKVSAIVTDEGGLGCHASVLAREFNLPCIIGTKYATEIFKDGDLVEVDANKGIVRKIK